jgi:Flp pilus assembly pilin Flp
VPKSRFVLSRGVAEAETRRSCLGGTLVRQETAMAAWASFAARGLADRKGSTAMEYAIIAAALAPLVLAGFHAFAVRIRDMIPNVAFT